MTYPKADKYILHLCADQKFIDHVIDVFESVYPGRNVYFIEYLEGESSLKLVESKSPNIIAGRQGSPEFEQLVKSIQDFAAVILHNIANPYKLDVITDAPRSVYFHWMSWGIDLYSVPVLYRNILLPRTRKLIRNEEGTRGFIVRFLRDYFTLFFNVLYYIYFRRTAPLVFLKRCHRRINSISTVLPEEYDLVRKYISDKIKYFPFKYITIEQFDNPENSKICTAGNILLGNSATAENNHLDAIALLAKLNLVQKVVYCPLSYGYETFRNYREHIITEGRAVLGDRFIPVTNFLPFEEYNENLNLCGNVVMNHIRQQAIGNVIMSLWKGARLFLNETNPVYGFLVKRGIMVFKTDDLGKMDSLPDYETLARCNRPILQKIYCREQVLKETEELVNVLINL